MRAIRWMPAVVLVAAAAALGLAVLLPDASPLPGVSTPPRTAEPSAPTTPPSAAPTAAPSAGAPIQVASYLGPPYDLNTVETPTEWTSQSKVWFNDGTWWSLMASEASGQVHVHELHWESQRWVDSGVPVDDRPFVRHEALWDGSSLHVAGSGPRNASSHAARYSRFAYDPESRRYVLQPDFPRTLTDRGVGAVSLARGGDGRIWMVSVEARRPLVRSSSDEGTTWSGPLDLSASIGSSAIERTATVETPEGIAVAWTTLEENELHVAQHANGDPVDAWSLESVIVDGLVYGEDDLSLRAANDGSVIAAVRTSLDRVQNRNLDAPLIVVVRLRDGEWEQAVAARVRDRLTGPQLIVDDTNGELYLFAESEGDIMVKRTAIDTLAFPSGSGSVAISSSILDEIAAEASPTPDATAAASAQPLLPELERVTSTKQPVGDLTEVVVLASDDLTGRYAHAIVALPNGRIGPAAEGHAGPLPEGVTPGLPTGSTTFLVRDTFAPYPAGPASISGWATRDEPPDEVATIVVPSEGDPALRLVPDASGSGARACREIPVTPAGRMVVGITAQTRGALESDATILHLRAPEGLAVTVRFGEPGTFRYFLGDERVTSPVPFAAGTWYRSVVTLDFTSQTYSWVVTPLGGTEPVLSVSDLPLRLAATSVSEICAEAGNELAGGAVELLVDDITVEVGPGG